MRFKSILYGKEEGIATITINLPKKANALNAETLLEIRSAIEDAERDEEVKVVIITGKGRAFSAGADVSEFHGKTSLEGIDFSRLGQGVFNEIEGLGKPVIAVLNGYALGGGLEMAMACDLRIASEDAKLGQTEVNLGVLPGFGGSQRLPRLVGKTKAKELILTGRMIDAEEAERIGLINKVVPADRLMAEAEAYAKELKSKPSATLKLAKSLIDQGLETSLERGLLYESDATGILLTTKETREGITEFLEKKKLKYKGE